jgi:hypothetical protein
MSKTGFSAPILQDTKTPSQIYTVVSGRELRVSRWYGISFENLDAAFDSALSETESITALSMSPDGQLFVAGTSEGRIYVRKSEREWRLVTTQPQNAGIVSISLGATQLLVVDTAGRLWHLDVQSTITE